MNNNIDVERIMKLISNVEEIGREIGVNETIKDEHPSLANSMDSINNDLKQIKTEYYILIRELLRGSKEY